MELLFDERLQACLNALLLLAGELLLLALLPQQRLHLCDAHLVFAKHAQEPLGRRELGRVLIPVRASSATSFPTLCPSRERSQFYALFEVYVVTAY